MKTVNLSTAVLNDDVKFIVLTKKDSDVLECIFKAAYLYFIKYKYKKLPKETLKYYNKIFNKKHAN